MLWEGLRIYSRTQYEALGPQNRFILTKQVREVLHPEIPETYLDKSLVLIEAGGRIEIEVEGSNFLAVKDDVPDYTIISMREAERRYPDDLTECRLTGSTITSKLYQDDQDALLSKPKKRGLLKRHTKSESKPDKKASAPPAKKDTKAVPAEKKVAASDSKKASKTPTAAKKPAKAEPKPEPPAQEPPDGSRKRKAVTNDGTIRPLWRRKK